MKKNISSLMLPLMLFALSSTAHASSDSLVDVFPLSIGNQWTYNYRYLLHDELPDVYYADTGLVSYLITAAIVTQDSTRWIFREMRNLIYTYFSPGDEAAAADTSYAVRDTNVFELIELQQGRHQIYRTVPSGNSNSTYSVFPFVQGFAESATLYRYSEVDSTNNLSISISASLGPYDPIRYLFDFKEGVGELSVFSHGDQEIVGTSNHSLKSYVLTSIAQSPDKMPTEYALLQNFPNPFNGSTQIQFQIPRAELAVLDLFDIVGRRIMTIFQGVAQPGLHTISLSSELFSSGVYFYQLKAGKYRETKKLILIK
ncbi:MAG: T9SS type A sorting domain-containing protein [Bacteroidota bacterium]